jgi:hypothetical protein
MGRADGFYVADQLLLAERHVFELALGIVRSPATICSMKPCSNVARLWEMSQQRAGQAR